MRAKLRAALTTALRGPLAIVLLLAGAAAAVAARPHATTGSTRPPLIRSQPLAFAPLPPYSDPITGVRAQVTAARLIVPPYGPPRGMVWLMVQIALRGDGSGAHYGFGDFYAIDSGGRSEAALVTAPSFPPLGVGTLTPGTSLRRWIGFTIADRPGTLELIWNDGGRLVPVRSLATLTV